jgi:hypothetical protein
MQKFLLLATLGLVPGARALATKFGYCNQDTPLSGTPPLV